jgi:hypothetical protein
MPPTAFPEGAAERRRIGPEPRHQPQWAPPGHDLANMRRWVPFRPPAYIAQQRPTSGESRGRPQLRKRGSGSSGGSGGGLGVHARHGILLALAMEDYRPLFLTSDVRILPGFRISAALKPRGDRCSLPAGRQSKRQCKSVGGKVARGKFALEDAAGMNRKHIVALLSASAANRHIHPATRYEPCLARHRNQRGNALSPSRNRSMARAAWRPSRIAQTTRDWPRRISPQANTLSTEER